MTHQNFDTHRSMIADPSIDSVAALIADPSRAAMLTALLDGRSVPASELAHCAQISPQTASAHLNKLMQGSLITVVQQGRHRYYQLASSEVAQLLEVMATIAPAAPVRSFNQSQQAQAIRFARTCYDHLAGELGVCLTQKLMERGILKPNGQDYDITELGRQWLTEFGIDLTTLQRQRRVLARPCLDWSERQYHLAGALGAAVVHHLLDLGWIVKVSNSRAICLTQIGQMLFKKRLGLEFVNENLKTIQ